MKAAVRMILFVLILASVLTGVLLVVDGFTAPRIARNEEIKTRRSILGALGIACEDDQLDAAFEAQVTEKKVQVEVDGVRKEVSFFMVADGTVAFAIAGSGMQGPIKAVLAVDPDGKTVKGLTIIRQEETPGLGGRIADKDFLQRFMGHELVPSLDITAEGKASGVNQVDGITGATRSCDAFEKMINTEACRYLPAVKKLQEGAGDNA